MFMYGIAIAEITRSKLSDSSGRHSPAPRKKVLSGNRDFAIARRVSLMSSPVTWSAGVTPHETRSRPAPQPRSTILIRARLQARTRGVNQLLLGMQREVGS